MSKLQTEIMVTGLAFPEGPRWHRDCWWFTDQHAHTLNAVDGDGQLRIVAHCEDLPGGLGWLPDGSLLMVYMTRRQIMRLENDELSLYADLSEHASFHCNDMVVDSLGRVYAGNFGYDLHGGDAQRAAEILVVDTDGSVEIFAEDVIFPNGSVITPDGNNLLVAETFAHRITAFGLDARGRMRSRQTWASLGDMTPDGICLDAEGALWVASPGTWELVRVEAGGNVVATVDTTGTPYACMLGGAERRTLMVCTSETDDPQQAKRLASGRIEAVEVDVPGAGLP